MLISSPRSTKVPTHILFADDVLLFFFLQNQEKPEYYFFNFGHICHAFWLVGQYGKVICIFWY